MKRWFAAVAASMMMVSAAAFADAVVGKAAPSFSLPDLSGKTVNLSDFKGKHVVLEWHNPGCPFVMKHYRSGNMPALQRKYAKDVVWLAINSTHTGHPDYRAPEKLQAFLQQHQSAPARYLMDTEGKVGQAYGAMTTPHMYVIDPAGKLIYVGAIDDIPSASEADLKDAKNYIVAAIDDIKAGKALRVSDSRPYGCSVKYKF